MPQQIGHYQILEELGRGAMGIVFRSLDPSIGRPVAIKVIRTQEFSSAAENEEARLRFTREASAAGRLSHPNIVTIYQLGEERGYRYLVMEFVPGSPLDKVMSNGTILPIKQIVSMLCSLADALDHAHGEGIVHRDIKPANIIVRPDGKVKITDFGIARVCSQAITKTGFTFGTPAYMAPEQIAAESVGGQADQFSLAVMACEMLSGKKPFEAPTDQAMMYEIVNAEPKRAHELNSALPTSCSRVIQKALSKSPAARYPTCTLFVQALTTSLQVTGHSDQTNGRPVQSALHMAVPPYLGRGGKRGLVPGVLLACALATLGLVFVRHSRYSTSTKTKPNPSATQLPTTTQLSAKTVPPSNEIGKSSQAAQSVAPPYPPHGAVPSAAPPRPPPPKEKPVTPSRIRVGGNVQAANLIRTVTPVYPALAKQARIQGTVRFSAVIGKDGSIQNLQLVSGPPLLVAAAQEAVKQWQYKPTLLNQEPVEVLTQIDVNFTLPVRQKSDKATTPPSIPAQAATPDQTPRATTPGTSNPASNMNRGTPEPGQVWVNPETKVFHRQGSKLYGTTKAGKYMSDSDAIKAGYRDFSVAPPPRDSDIWQSDKRAIYALLLKWEKATRDQNIIQLMDCYAPQVKFYGRLKNFSQKEVALKKEAFFNSVRRFDVSGQSIESLNDKEAVVLLSEHLNMVAPKIDGVPDEQFLGIERMRLLLGKIAGNWKIVSEEPIK